MIEPCLLTGEYLVIENFSSLYFFGSLIPSFFFALLSLKGRQHSTQTLLNSKHTLKSPCKHVRTLQKISLQFSLEIKAEDTDHSEYMCGLSFYHILVTSEPETVRNQLKSIPQKYLWTEAEFGIIPMQVNRCASLAESTLGITSPAWKQCLNFTASVLRGRKRLWKIKTWICYSVIHTTSMYLINSSSFLSLLRWLERLQVLKQTGQQLLRAYILCEFWCNRVDGILELLKLPRKLCFSWFCTESMT